MQRLHSFFALVTLILMLHAAPIESAIRNHPNLIQEQQEEVIATKAPQLVKKPSNGLFAWFFHLINKLLGTTSKAEADFSSEDLEKYLGNPAATNLDDQSPTE